MMSTTVCRRSAAPEVVSSLKKPDFFIVGAPKCGTTAMAEYLASHPDISVRSRVTQRPRESTFVRFLFTLMSMPETSLNVLAVVGSLQRSSVTRVVIHHVAEQLRTAGCIVDPLDFLKEPLALYNPDTAHELAGYTDLQARVERADVIILGTPDYHGGLSGAMKNFLDHFWHEFAGKLIATIVASHEKGLTVTDQLRTIARQCYAWTLPYGVSVGEDTDVKEGEIISDSARTRLAMLVRDARVYGEVLARQRRADLAGTEPGFLARHRQA